MQRSREAEKQRSREAEIVDFFLEQKIRTKCLVIAGLPSVDLKLFRSVFPEANRQMLRYFLKAKTKISFVMLLAAWHLDLPARALVWGYRKLAGKRYK